MKQASQQANQVKHCQIWLGVLLLFALGISVFADESVPCPSYGRPSSIATIADDRLTEISGLVSGQSQPGILWVHNDSGDAAVVYAIDLEGQLLVKVQLVSSDGSKINAVDCEDIALGSGPSGGDFLYLADIGDNTSSRESIRIYRFREPTFNADANGRVVQVTVECDVMEAVYPDSARDAETLLVDPISGDLVIVSKDFIHARAYRMSDTIGEASTLEFLVELPWGFMTGGDISPDGSNILLRGYWNAEIWSRSAGTNWWMMLALPGCPAPLALESQGEAIGFRESGTGYLTVSEGYQPMLHSYRLELDEPAD